MICWQAEIQKLLQATILQLCGTFVTDLLHSFILFTPNIYYILSTRYGVLLVAFFVLHFSTTYIFFFVGACFGFVIVVLTVLLKQNLYITKPNFKGIVENAKIPEFPNRGGSGQ